MFESCYFCFVILFLSANEIFNSAKSGAAAAAAGAGAKSAGIFYVDRNDYQLNKEAKEIDSEFDSTLYAWRNLQRTDVELNKIYHHHQKKNFSSIFSSQKTGGKDYSV